MKKVLIYCVLSLTAACCWRSPDSSFYMMNSQNLETVSQKQLSVAVQTINVPELLDRPQIVTYDAQSQKVNMLEFSRWGEALPAVLQNKEKHGVCPEKNTALFLLPQERVLRQYQDRE